MKSTRNEVNRAGLINTDQSVTVYSNRQESIKYVFKRRILKNWRLYIFVLPAVLYYILFKYRPIYGIILAFKDYKASLGIWGSKWVGFEHFIRLFSSYWFPVIMKNTLTLSVLGLIVGFPFPIILALSLNEVKNSKFRKFVQTVTYAPHFISTMVLCGVVIMFLSPEYGIINKLIQLFGSEPVFFMQKGSAFKWIYVLSGVWQNAGWSSIIYFAALSGVDPQLLEAAEMDGANRFQRIWHINLPTIMPTIVILLILNCGSLLSIGHEKVYLLQNQANLTASEVISTYVYKVGLVQSDYGFSTAVGLFNSVINSILLVSVNFIAKRLGKTSLY